MIPAGFDTKDRGYLKNNNEKERKFSFFIINFFNDCFLKI